MTLRGNISWSNGTIASSYNMPGSLEDDVATGIQAPVSSDGRRLTDTVILSATFIEAIKAGYVYEGILEIEICDRIYFGVPNETAHAVQSLLGRVDANRVEFIVAIITADSSETCLCIVRGMNWPHVTNPRPHVVLKEVSTYNHNCPCPSIVHGIPVSSSVNEADPPPRDILDELTPFEIILIVMLTYLIGNLAFLLLAHWVPTKLVACCNT